jgi:cytochrome c6
VIPSGSEPTASPVAGSGVTGLWRWLVSLAIGLFLLLALILPPPALGTGWPAFALAAGEPEAAVPDPQQLERGARLFEAHCVGCHVNGGNIMRRARTLKLAALERNGLAHPEAIAEVAAAGIGRMGGYGDSLGEGGPEAVAAWVWQQALEGWPRQ